MQKGCTDPLSVRNDKTDSYFRLVIKGQTLRSNCFQPRLAQVKSLLRASDLPVVDLHENNQVRFFACGEQTMPLAVIGIESHGPYGLLRSLAVSHAERGQGLGKVLVAEVEDYARRQRLQAIYLLTTTAPEFFLKLGYEVVTRDVVPGEIRQTSEFASICPDDAVVMMKPLDE